ncbi:MAG: polysaccharide pyruvyl transferase family protein [Thermodesulfobacteriota bacterium]|nr:polysaccharide pyruvyl transferase family protein [Thermodesulfobacteriota bacterium]
MQAYCLQKLLQSLRPEARIEVIDCRSSKIEKKEFLKCFIRRPPFINMWQWNKRAKLRSFLRSHMILSPKACVTDTIQKAIRFISDRKYDAIVVGSDTVWRIRAENGEVVVPSLYYLPGIHASRKVAFAASLDMTDGALLSESRKHLLSSLIRDFDFVSVRDEMSMRYLKEFGLDGKGLFFMPDPTVLWDFSSIVQTPKDFFHDSRLAGVAVPDELMRKRLTEILQKKNYRVVNFLGSPVEGQVPIPQHYTLQKRLGVYRLLRIMVTDRFHSSIFTFKLGGVPVILLENADKYPADVMSKGRDLFHRLGIEWSVCRYSKENFEIKMIDKMLNDWERIKPDIESGLSRLKLDAAAYLDKII